MFPRYEFELANEIHQEHLRRAERARLQLMAEAVTMARTKKWSIKTHKVINFLHRLWGGTHNVKTYNPVK